MVRPPTTRLAVPLPPSAALALLGSSLILAWIAMRMLLAALFAIQANAFILDWKVSRAEPTTQAWDVAHQAVASAIRLFPVANGTYLENLGRIHTWQHGRRPFGDPAAAPSRRQALAAYRAAVAARPLWPWTWTQVAWTKLALGERDAEFRNAVHQAHTLGPWRPSINRNIAEIGLLAWRTLDVDARTLTLEAARRVVAQGSTGEAKWLEDTAKRSGTTEVLCAALTEEIRRKYRICPL